MTKLAPIYKDGLVAIFHADSTNLRFLPKESIHLIVTSPPYNFDKKYGASSDALPYEDYLDWVRTWGEELKRVLVVGGRLCLNVPLDTALDFNSSGKRVHGAVRKSVASDYTQLFVNDVGLLYNATILWIIKNRANWGPGYGSRLGPANPWILTAAEAIIVLSKEQRRRDDTGRTFDIEENEFAEWKSGLWDIPDAPKHLYRHPAPFPEELPRRLIKLYSFKEDIILDPFLGSGTTCRVAKNLGRRSIGVEINKRYAIAAANVCRNIQFGGSM